MNVFNKVTIQSLKKNRTRTIVTIIGIILSAAMICAVTTFTSSMQNYVLRNSIYSDGDWHGCENNTSYSVYENVWNSGEVEDAIYLQQVGYAYAEGCTNEYKPYIYVLGGSKGTSDMLPIHITSGEYPTSAEEILLPEHLAVNGGVTHEIGDTLTLELGNRMLDGFVLNQNNPIYVYEEGQEVLTGETLEVRETRTYTVVGFYKRFQYTIEGYSAPGYTAITIADKDSSADYRYDIYFKMEEPQEVYEFMEEKGYTGNTNNDVLMYQGISQYDGFTTMLVGLASIVIGLIMFGSISLIYNAFSISVSERTKQFGLLSSIGATKRQLRKMVLFEAFVVAAIGIPIGVVSGIAGIGVTLMLIGNKFTALGMPLEMELSVSPVSVVIAVIVALVTVLISAWVPSKRATKVSAVEAIRQNIDVKTESKPIKTSKLTYKLFGLPGVLASKHYKRSKKKYRTTVMSLFMSIVLFVSASAFTEYLMESVSGGFGTNGYDLWYAGSESNFNGKTAEEVFALFKSDKDIDKATYVQEEYFSGYISTEYLNDGVAENVLGGVVDSSIMAGASDSTKDYAEIYGYVYFVPDNEYKILLKQHNLDEDEFMNPEHPLAITIDGGMAFDTEQGRFVSTNKLNSDECVITYSTMKDEAVIEFNLESGKTVYEYPYYIEQDSAAYFKMIYPSSMYAQVIPEEARAESAYFRFYMTSDDHAASYENLKQLLSENGIDTNVLIDYAAGAEVNRNLVTIIQVFSYGFIVLISLIAAANVFNTISTNISLRRREFAMLKSVGMTAKGFNRMMNFECLLYGSRALLFGLPVSCGITYLIYQAITEGYETSFHLPWGAIAIAAGSVFLVVLATMMYSMSKIKKDNPIEALKNENL